MDRQMQLPRRSKTTVVLPTYTTEKGKSDSLLPAKYPPAPRPSSGSRIRNLAWLGVVIAILGAGAFFRFQSSESAETNSPSQPSVRQVNVTLPERAATGDIDLPGTIQAYQATDLYARANGFLKAWHPEIGTVVKMGEVLAEIETPELDQELAQSVALLTQGRAEHQQAIAELEEARAEVTLAEANVAKAKANVEFVVNQAIRYEALLASKATSQEEYENIVRDRDTRKAELESTKADLQRKKANLTTRQAIIDSRAAVVGNREANVQRLRDLTGFQNVVAPFDGIVTRRNAEVGMLVTAGSGTGNRPLFSVAQIDVLRVQVAVPQSSALSIKPGDQALVTIPEKPGQVFTAKVARTAGAVEPASRSLLVEVELPNHDGKLLPGIYAQIRFQSTSAANTWIIPAKTLLMRSDGPHVAIVSPEGTLRLQKLNLGRDFGTTAEVLGGLTGGERLVVNPADDMRDGHAVRIAVK